jgi:hypothetical protein
MRAAIRNRRLHRDVGEASIILIDEAARQWGRVQTNLMHPFWNASGLPMHYEAIRDQAGRAADGAMDEILSMLKPMLPLEGEKRPLVDFLGEAIEGLTKKGSKSDEPIPPMFEPTRQLTEKLHAMADELERITSRASVDPGTFAQRGAAPALDNALYEMRALSRAEQELTGASESQVETLEQG